MKKIWSILALLLMLMAVKIPVAGAAVISDSDVPIDIKVNGSYIKTDAGTYIDYDTTFVPIRFVSEALGAGVTWDGPSATVTIIDDGTAIQLTEGKRTAYVNGAQVDLKKSVRITGGRTFVPVRFVSESLGAAVGWDESLYIVTIDKPAVQVNKASVKDWYADDEVLWLARLIEAESAAEPMEGMIAVGNVVLNRVNSSDFPDTIHDVVFDTAHGVQFEPVLNGRIYNQPSLASIAAAKRALQGESYAGDSLFFFNPAIATSTWISENRTYYVAIENHAFYL